MPIPCSLLVGGNYDLFHFTPMGCCRSDWPVLCWNDGMLQKRLAWAFLLFFFVSQIFQMYSTPFYRFFFCEGVVGGSLTRPLHIAYLRSCSFTLPPSTGANRKVLSNSLALYSKTNNEFYPHPGRQVGGGWSKYKKGVEVFCSKVSIESRIIEIIVGP